MIKDLSFDLFDVVNKIQIDKFGRVSAFLALNKPIGITSHDLVDQVRRKLKTRKVGHAGALDPFASGAMLILVGKQYTRLAETLITLDKSYRAKVLFGVTTDTLDTEGEVLAQSDTTNLTSDSIKSALESFEGGYEQFVPVFSSVKVQGNKLRVLARQSEKFEFFAKDGVKYVRFYKKDGNEIELELPKKKIVIEDVELLSEGVGSYPKLTQGEYPFAEVEFGCSKGTYVRQFAYDLAQEVDQVGMLVELTRSKVGSIKLEDCVGIDDISL